MNIERDKFLTEAMGEKLYWMPICEDKDGDMVTILRKFDTYEKAANYVKARPRGDAEQRKPFNFSTWVGFGKLWEWIQDQEWAEEFLDWYNHKSMCYSRGQNFTYRHWYIEFVHPDRFADAVYEFLKGR